MENETIEKVAAIGKTAKGLKIAMGVGVTAIVGYAAYRFVVKPAITKIKAKKDISVNHEPVEIEVEKEPA